MKILLINNNPVVSRLTALSARKEDIEIDEIQEVTELNSDKYDIVFVDADSWTKDVRDVISENLKTEKTVLFYADGDEEEKNSFDVSILKPFLPSEVSAVIRSVEASSKGLKDESHFNVIEDSKAKNKNKKLEDTKEEIALNLEDDLELKTKDVSFDEKLEEAFSSKKSSLDDNLLDDNDLFDLDLKDDNSLLDNDLFAKDKKEDKKEEISLLTDKFDLEDNVLDIIETPKEKESSKVSLEEEFSLELDEPLAEEKKVDESSKEKESSKVSLEEEFSLELDEPLAKEKKVDESSKEKESSKVSLEEDFSLELDEPLVKEKKVDEPKIEEEKKESTKKETQILDELEIENIKGILTEDISDEITLDELMTPVTVMPSIVESPSKEKDVLKEELKIERVETEKKGTKKESDNDDTLDFDNNVLSQTLAAMSVEDLRELLAGAKVNITIKFPKSKS